MVSDSRLKWQDCACTHSLIDKKSVRMSTFVRHGDLLTYDDMLTDKQATKISKRPGDA